MMLSFDTAYRSFGGEVEASSTPTICRLPDSRRHQLSAIAPGNSSGGRCGSMRVLLSWLGATVPVVLARPAVAGPRFVSDDPEPTPFSSVHIRPVHSRRMPYLGALARMALIPPAASPYGLH